jgi:hypothetical protein
MCEADAGNWYLNWLLLVTTAALVIAAVAVLIRRLDRTGKGKEQ